VKIGELAKQSGVAAHTIRFYESEGLLPRAARGGNGYRQYTEDSLLRLATIQCAKRLGFSLEDIQAVFANRADTQGPDHDKVLEQLDSRLEEVEALVKGLLQQRDEIVQLKQQLQDSWQEGQCAYANGILQRELTPE